MKDKLLKPMKPIKHKNNSDSNQKNNSLTHNSNDVSQQVWLIALQRQDWITLMTLLFSSVGIYCVMHGYYELALSLAFVGMLSDALDGTIARKNGTTRNFGRFLDSHVDLVLYLLFPSLFWFQLGFDGWQSLWLILLMGAGIIRLSVFNDIGLVQSKQRLAYQGLPVYWIMFALAGSVLVGYVTGKDFVFSVLPLLILILAGAMNLNRPFPKITDISMVLLITGYGASIFVWLHYLVFFAGVSLTNQIQQTLIIYTPLVLSASFHMASVRYNWLSQLDKPLNLAMFGANKTWRGLLIVPVVGAVLGGVMSLLVGEHDRHMPSLVMIGLLTGLGYMLAELPNSWFKRKMNIAPGSESARHRWFFLMLDQMDSCFGIALALLLLGLSWIEVLTTFILGPLIHLLVKRILFWLGLKGQPF